MAVRFYDEAIVNKIQKWIKDPNMVILKPNEVGRLFQVRADQKNDQPLTLPLIAISRDPSLNMDVSTKRSLSCDGLKVGSTVKDSVQLDAIPISITYQIDIYTQRYEEGDEYLRNFIFNFINHPKMKILIPYNGSNIEHICYTRLSNTATDNSDVSEKLFPDQFTRWTLQIEIHDAYLFSVPVKENGQIVGAMLELTNPAVYKNKEPKLENIVWEGDIIESDITAEEEVNKSSNN